MAQAQYKVPSYEEYLKGQLDTAKTNAADTRAKAINNAQLRYNQDSTTYGSQAAALSNMGLTGSGYSQYLQGQALAQKNAAIQSAYNAEQNAVRDAQNAYDTSYMGYLQQQEQNRTNAFNHVLENIGNYTLSDLIFLSGQQGFNTEQNKFLADKILANDTYTVKDIEAAKGIIGEDAANSYIEKLKNMSIDTTPNSFNYTDETGAVQVKDANEAKNEIDYLEQRGVNPETINALRTSYDAVYGVKTDDTLKVNNYGNRDWVEDDNFSVKDSDGNKYYLESAGEETDQNVKNAATGVKTGALFMYRNKVYVKVGDRVIKVRTRFSNSEPIDLASKFK